MKKTLTSLLNRCQPEELDGVLENIEIDLPDEASADTIKTLALQKAGVKPRRPIRKLVLIAACIALVAAVLVGCYVAEKVEYDAAVKFFDLNDFDTEGLSRDDIKRVYRDFTTERFAYNDSYELLESNRSTDTVAGVDISIMNSANDLNNSEIGAIGSGRYDSRIRGDIPADTDYFFDKGFSKEVAGKPIWHFGFDHEYENYCVAGGKVLLWGEEVDDPEHCYMHTYLALLDDKDGKAIWEKKLESSYHFCDDPTALLTDDGRIAVLTIETDDRFHEEKYLEFRELNLKGEVVTSHEQREDDLVFTDYLTALSDGWLAELQYESIDAELENSVILVPRLTKFSRQGEIESEWTLTEENMGNLLYEIKEITEYDEKIFLSIGMSEQVMTIPDDTDYETLEDGFSDKWRDYVRERYQSTLYVLDSNSGKPEQFYSVGGTLAGDLRVDDNGNLVWQVGRIVKCGYAPWANSYSLYGITRRYDYTFDSDKNLLKQERTDIFKRFQIM